MEEETYLKVLFSKQDGLSKYIIKEFLLSKGGSLGHIDLRLDKFFIHFDKRHEADHCAKILLDAKYTT